MWRNCVATIGCIFGFFVVFEVNVREKRKLMKFLVQLDTSEPLTVGQGFCQMAVIL